MKYVHYEEATGKILGWYDDAIHGVLVPEVPEVLNEDGTVKIPAVPAYYDISGIPTPNAPVNEEDWALAIANNYDYYDAASGTLSYKDFRTFDQIKQSAKQKIESAYQRAIQAPIVLSVGGSGHTFQADHGSQDTLSKVIVSAPDGFEVDWLDADNNPVHMTLDDLRGMAMTILARGQSLFAEKVLLKRKIDGATAIEEVEAIASNAFQQTT
jgi:hypothetical protein